MSDFGEGKWIKTCKDGRCIDCDKPCNDHDLVADYHWCDICLSKSWEKYENRKRAEAERKK